ncbi:BON domain-containing protein [Aromatoleum toluvorans]|uniref:BON domain-containing protein n=1 Tax=Aromatoleum toluvorans TaxID=92002 RepID=A0ABX1Q1U2_9RHOO|nr:BON domain-containing protein [Aromatoleum toluvorans]NMG45400.1 BON domain-containing protein [Aromatoleum toluvorans]
MHRIIARTTLLAAVLTALTACSGTPTRESTGEYIDDSVITTRVKTAFVQDKAVDALDIKVVTFKGAVQLSGFANDKQEMERAVQLARNVKGVTSVKNDIRLK